MNDVACPFCSYVGELVHESDFFTAIYDRFPVARGHTLVVPRIHVFEFFELEPKALAELMPFVSKVLDRLRDSFELAGYNIGVNGGAVAGQTVGHAHLHIIPRYIGDCEDPRGGVRHIFPDKARYWE
ncbi:MAG: HIT family protein [Actinomycetota bacterium]|nr:HIT family protein [Actinomycetota bacterium]